jgi:plasmid stabilization system protein ParE
MTDDDDLRRLREQTAEGDRLDTAETKERQRALVDALVDELAKIDQGDRSKTVSVWDGSTAAYLAALDDNPEARAELADGLADALDQPVDDPDRSDLLRHLIRLGLRTAAPEHVDALREAVREQAVEGL